MKRKFFRVVVSVFRVTIRVGQYFGMDKNVGGHVEAIEGASRMMGGIAGSFGVDNPQALERPAKAYIFLEMRRRDSKAARSHQQLERCQSRRASQHSAFDGISG